MKKVTLVLLLLFAVFAANSQDIIVKNDKTELKVKVVEITETTITYKKFELLDGPLYSIKKTEVFMIMYQNGTKEYMQAAPSQPSATTAPPTKSVTAVMQQANTGFQSSSSGTKKKSSGTMGAQLSILSTTASFGDVGTASAVIRLRAGLYCRIPLSSTIAFEPSINIVGKGAKSSYSDSYSSAEESFNLSFIELPLAFVYTAHGSRGLQFGIAPTLSFCIAQNEKATFVDYTSGSTYTTDGNPGFKSTELGGSVVLGYRFSSLFALSAIYNHSFSNIAQTGMGTYSTRYMGLSTAIGF